MVEKCCVVIHISGQTIGECVTRGMGWSGGRHGVYNKWHGFTTEKEVYFTVKIGRGVVVSTGGYRTMIVKLIFIHNLLPIINVTSYNWTED